MHTYQHHSHNIQPTYDLHRDQLYERTTSVDVEGKSQTADKLAQWLQLPSSKIRGRSDPDAKDFVGRGADIIIVLGADVNLTGLESANASLQESTTGS